MPPNRKLSQLRLGQWNANGICLKWDELKDFILKHNVDIMAICETKLDDKVNLSMPGYTITRRDRNRQGGGVMIVCKNEIKHHELTTQTSTIETIGIKLDNGHCLFSTYTPPQITMNTSDLCEIFKTANQVTMMGDLNAKHNTWSNQSSNKNGRTIYNFASNKPITILDPGKPTTRPINCNNKPSTIDIALVKNPKAIPEVKVLDELNSDHLPIITDFSVHDQVNRDTRQSINLRKINWDKFRDNLQNLEINNMLNTIEKIDQSVETITRIINEAIKQSTPTTKPFAQKNHLPDHIKSTIRLRDAARRRFQRTRSDSTRELYKQLTNQAKKEIREWKNQGWNNKLEQLKTTDNTLWRMTKALTKRKKYKMPPLVDGNKTATTDEEKAEALANNFEKVHKLTEKMGDQIISKNTERLADNITNNPEGAEEVQHH